MNQPRDNFGYLLEERRNYKVNLFNKVCIYYKTKYHT